MSDFPIDPDAPSLEFEAYPQQIPRFTARPVTPEIERAATERAQQAAEDSERAAAWMAQHSSPHPAETALARIAALAAAHPVTIDTALIHEALATSKETP